MTEQKPNLPTVLMVILVLLLAFSIVGSGDYQLELERENARLKASVAGCRLAAEMRGQP